MKILTVPPYRKIFLDSCHDLSTLDPADFLAQHPINHIAGKIIPIGSKALPPKNYKLIIYTLLTDNRILDEKKDFYWWLEKFNGSPLIETNENGFWSTEVKVGYLYFIAVTKYPEKFQPLVQCQKKIPVKNPKDWTITKFVWPRTLKV